MSQVQKVFTATSYQATYTVEKSHDGMRLDQFLQIFYDTTSRQTLKRRIEGGFAQITGRGPHPHRPSTKVREGDVVVVTVEKSTQEDEYWRGERLELLMPETIYEDEHLFVMSKPPYMTTHPSGRRLFHCATVYYEELYGGRVFSVHRLDRETSGVMMLARDAQTAKELTQEFEHERVQKCYFLIAKKITNDCLEESFTAHERIGEAVVVNNSTAVMMKTYPQNSEEGKKAETDFFILHQAPVSDYICALAFPHTGRQHQIRVHAQAHGFALVGDKLYLGSYAMFQRFKDGLATDEDHDLMELPRQALHATALKVNYKKQPQIYRSPIPDDFATWLQQKLPEIRIEDLESKIEKKLKSTF